MTTTQHITAQEIHDAVLREAEEIYDNAIDAARETYNTIKNAASDAHVSARAAARDILYARLLAADAALDAAEVADAAISHELLASQTVVALNAQLQAWDAYQAALIAVTRREAAAAAAATLERPWPPEDAMAKLDRLYPPN